MRATVQHRCRGVHIMCVCVCSVFVSSLLSLSLSVQVLCHLPYTHLNLVTYLNYAWLWRKFSTFRNFFENSEHIWLCLVQKFCVKNITRSNNRRKTHRNLPRKTTQTSQKIPRKMFVLDCCLWCIQTSNIFKMYAPTLADIRVHTNTLMQNTSNQEATVCLLSICIKLSNH